MAMYESDITQFVRELLDKNPQLKELQKNNRATWWDKKLDLAGVEAPGRVGGSEAGLRVFPVAEGRRRKYGQQSETQALGRLYRHKMAQESRANASTLIFYITVCL